MKFRHPFFLLTLAFLAGCGRHETPAARGALPPVRVRLAAVQAENIPQLTDVPGAIRPVRRAVLAAKVTGSIAELSVGLGQKVRADEVLVKIFSADAAARVTQARAQLNGARRDLGRERELLVKGASTADMVRNLEDRFTGAEAMVRDAEVQLSYAEIRAPFDGVIARKPANAGDLASPGQPLLELEETANFEIEAAVPDSFVAASAVGATLECESGGVTFSATVREISSAADPATHSTSVKLSVPAATTVRSGQFVRVRIPGPAVRTLLVPSAAVSVSGQMERVFVSGAGNAATLRLVKTGAVRGDRVEVLSGLTADDRVVLAPPVSLRDGQPLEVQP